MAQLPGRDLTDARAEMAGEEITELPAETLSGRTVKTRTRFGGGCGQQEILVPDHQRGDIITERLPLNPHPL
ncbi:hypothetical protein ACFWBV_35420, partial [Streptomyces sp. NPDC060030]|uniref:hypothetical protein n=1 Tax=Streptomyces sp. NPDC060030 TaxID=3347042 RepID=UPI0036B0584B